MATPPVPTIVLPSKSTPSPPSSPRPPGSAESPLSSSTFLTPQSSRERAKTLVATNEADNKSRFFTHSSSAPRTIPTEYLALSAKMTPEEELDGIGGWAASLSDRTGLAEMMGRRRNIISELGSTEHSYLDQLNALNTFKDTVTQQNLLSSEEIDNIFSVITFLSQAHTKLYNSMRKRMGSWSCNAAIGDIFVNEVRFLILYSHYFNKYVTSVNTLLSCREKNSAFFKLLSKTEFSSLFCGLDMFSLLIVPIQRIPRYILLLKQLDESTPTEHPDKPFLKEALEFTTSTMTTLNKKKEEAEAMAEIIQVQSKIPDLKTALNSDPSRRFTSSTDLSVNGNKRTAFLFNDILIVAKRTTVTPEKYVFKGQMLLEICTVHDVTGKTNQILLASPDTSLTLKLKTDEDAVKWKDLLREGVQYSNNKLLTTEDNAEGSSDRRTHTDFVKRRLDILTGLKNTSKQLAEQTEHILNAIVTPLLKSTENPASSLSKSSMQGLLDATQQLFSHYSSVAAGLENRLAQPLLWSDTACEILNLAELETVFKSYVQHQTEANAAIEEANKNPGFAYWVLELEAAEKKSITQVLHKPLCVLSELVPTLEELLSVTPHKNADHDQLPKRISALHKLEKSVTEHSGPCATTSTTTPSKVKKTPSPRRF
ncbi:Guanine exchange factor for Rac 30 [Pelomyxa schiedti]|nr:Guanine exchange factor for Rac 30 [Pelomyxa schiedti]